MRAKVKNTRVRDGVYYGRLMVRGREIEASLETKDARIATQRVKKWVADTRAKYANGWTDTPERRTLEEAILAYKKLAFGKLGNESKARYSAALAQLAELTTDAKGKLRALTDVTVGDLRNYLAARRNDGVSDGTIRLELRVLSMVYDAAIADEWTETNIAQVFLDRNSRYIAQQNVRRRILTYAEEAALIRAILTYPGRRGKHRRTLLAAYVIVCIETGLRADELLFLRWRNVSFDRREIEVLGKGDKLRVVPLRQRALATLRGLQAYMHTPYEDDLIFWSEQRPGEAISPFNDVFNKSAKKAKIEGLVIHDLRRTCGARLLRDGARMEEVSKWLGHESVQVTQKHYAWLDTASLHRLVGNPVVREERAELDLGFLVPDSGTNLGFNEQNAGNYLAISTGAPTF